ncbi:MAG: hypothetical protein SFX72_10610 [Isosphaeraceae bacterium]|nr:hypothetical protein [Isosphaeraceae bacterium]
MRHTHLRAPSSDAAFLEVPPLSEIPAAVERRLPQRTFDVQGRRSDILAEFARGEVIAAARDHHASMGLDAPPDDLDLGRIVATGHQPELFHPGVWVKNFALAAIARRSGATALNLIVDNDLPKGPILRVPTMRAEGLGREVVAFDSWTADLPYEAQAIADRERFADFRERVLAALGGLIPDPLIDRFWPAALEEPPTDDPRRRHNVGLRFSTARRKIEAEWGIRNLEVPLSRVCETDGFRWFASRLLAGLSDFSTIHNRALAAYRRLYRIRSKNHPVADLGVDRDGRLEAPFWVWRDRDPRRRALWARTSGDSTSLWIAGEDQPFIVLPLSADRTACCAVERLRELPEQGIRLRTRALTTTMFARLFLSDLFIHGIGGAKYDELGDAIMEEFFGVEPPRFLTLSLTLHAGLPRSDATREALAAAERTIRDAEFRPEVFLDASDDPTIRAAIDRKSAAIAASTATRRERVARFHAIRAASAEMRPFVEEHRLAAIAERSRLAASLARDAVARSREYASVLHSAARLERIPDLVDRRIDAAREKRAISD